MKNISTGFGLCVAAAAALAYPFVSSLAPSANASAVTTAASAVSTAAAAQTGPTIVWYGVTATSVGSGQQNIIYHRLWSDGRTEIRFAAYYSGCSAYPTGCSWVEVPPPPSGNGFACRADLDGNRVIDGADLGIILANWGQQPPCEPEATFPCMTIPGGTLAPLVP